MSGPAHGRRDDEVELGYVSGIFGVRGEVRLHLHHRESDLLNRGGRAVLIAQNGTRTEVKISTRAGAGKRVLGSIDGVNNRDEAAALMGSKVVVNRDELPALETDEFYYGDLEGLPVEMDGVLVGQVVRVHDGGGAEVLEIALSDGGQTWVPCVREQVERIDTASGRVVLFASALED